MRNLAKNPITQPEVVEILDRLIAEAVNKDQVGDLTPCVLASLRLMAKEHWDLIDRDLKGNVS